MKLFPNDYYNNPIINTLLYELLWLTIKGFAIFSVLGYMYLTKCVSSFAEVAAQGPELAFVVYPEGNIILPGLKERFDV